MRVTQIIADLQVTNLEVAKGFYTDYLGLTVEEFNLGWVASYTCPETGANLQLMTRDATAPKDPVISVKVDDVEAAYSQAQERGFEIVHPLTTEEWGVTRFFVRAPDGNPSSTSCSIATDAGTSRTARSSVGTSVLVRIAGTVSPAAGSNSRLTDQFAGRSRSLGRHPARRLAGA